MRRRQAPTNCGNGTAEDNVEILNSWLEKITLNSIVKVYRAKEWVNTRGQKIRKSADVGLSVQNYA